MEARTTSINGNFDLPDDTRKAMKLVQEIVNAQHELIGAASQDERDRASVKMTYAMTAMATMALEEMTNSESGPANSFDLEISVG